MRTYEKIWKILKEDQRCFVRCNPQLIPRIRKAVGKEKWLDVEFRETGFTRMIHVPHADGVEFILKDYRPMHVILSELRVVTIEDRQ